MLSLIRERRLQAALCGAILECNFDRVQETVSQKLDLNFTRFGSSPLSLAVWKANRRIVDFLLAHGAHPAAPGNETLLVAAARAGHLELLNLALAAGLDLHHRPDKMSTPLEAAALHNRFEMVAQLVAHGATKDDFDGQRCSWVRLRTGTVKILMDLGVPVPEEIVQHIQKGTWFV
jgi:hypothetical protein